MLVEAGLSATQGEESLTEAGERVAGLLADRCFLHYALMLSLSLYCLILAITTTHALYCVLVLTAFHPLHLVAFAVAIDWCTFVLAWRNGGWRHAGHRQQD